MASTKQQLTFSLQKCPSPLYIVTSYVPYSIFFFFLINSHSMVFSEEQLFILEYRWNIKPKEILSIISPILCLVIFYKNVSINNISILMCFLLPMKVHRCLHRYTLFEYAKSTKPKRGEHRSETMPLYIAVLMEAHFLSNQFVLWFVKHERFLK